VNQAELINQDSLKGINMAGQTFSAGGPKAAARSSVATGNASNVSEKEDLASFISMISRAETPFRASIGSTKAKAILHEWQTDALAAPVAGQVAEGVSYSTQQAAQAQEPDRTRLGAYTQINSKTVTVTGTKKAVDQAGVADEYAYQLKKRGIELKRDQEFGLVATNQSSNGSGTRTFGGYQSWANVNVEKAFASGYTAPNNTGAGIAGTYTAVTTASVGAIQLSHVDVLMQSIYEKGGKASKVMLSPANKRAFSSRAQIAGAHATSSTSIGSGGNVRRNIDEEGRLRQSVDVYMSDFGEISVVPNYIMGLSSTITGVSQGGANFFGFVYDPMWFAWATLRPLHEIPLGQLGDSTIGQIVEEGTLECKNPDAVGLITQLNGA
jgi:Family of unknown function (DUF5309)